MVNQQRIAAGFLIVLIFQSFTQSTAADTFGSGANTFNVEFVSIGSPGNPADTTGFPNPAGSVSYAYRIGKYEISEQMIDTANTVGGLGITKDARGADKPATSISWNEAARFINWLNTTGGSTPAYKFALQPGEVGYDANANIELWTPGDAGYDATNLYRNRLARYFLPSFHEWYKAAYFDPTSGVYYNLPTGSDSAPTAVASGTAVGTAVYGQSFATGPADITVAGGLSPYGTMGQGGNANEWQETDFDLVNDNISSGFGRGIRGGGWAQSSSNLGSTSASFTAPPTGPFDIGFRVASNIPEPSTLLLLCVGSLAVLWRSRGLVRVSILTAVVCTATSAQAVTIELVPIGNPGNTGEVQSQGTFGAVDYNYRIGKTEVTNAQYAEFLNGVDSTGANVLALYNNSMSSSPHGGITFNGAAANGSKYEIKPGRANNPVVLVSWYDSIRFANWLHNGQGSGDTENGAYTLLGGTPTPSNANSITRNPAAQWWLPSENEWYKAAYHKNDGVTSNYWDYPTSTDAIPYSDQPPGSGAPAQANTANFFKDDATANGYDDGFAVTGSNSFVPSQNYLTNAGAYPLSASPYGTLDQGGNVNEWNEALISPSFRGVRGGNWFDSSVNLLASDRIAGFLPAIGDSIIGFRVASVAIPEPSTLLLLCFGSLAVLWRRRLVFASVLAAAVGFSFADCAQAVTIDTVPVGNPGNAGEVQADGTFGAVANNYRIGKTEVTNAQYVEFLNGVDATGANTLALYNSLMSSDALGGINFNGGAANGSKYEIKPGRDNNPVILVSWYDSIRFANWLHNGQGAGNTEDGAYTLLGGTATPSNGLSITRNASAKWWLPSEDEWYKAAYHKNDGVTGNYWDYPTSTDAVPYSDQPPGSGAPDLSNTANFFKDDSVANGYDDGYAVTGSTLEISSQNYLTDVGAYTLADSPYGTFDQGGNVWEWNEALILGSFRGLRGGSRSSFYDSLGASFQSSAVPTAQDFRRIGFRVASNIPEPSTLLLLCVGSLAVLATRKGN